MFLDKAKLHLKAGDGGKGCMSFRREKYVPLGGPDGGDGGHGGNVIFRADSNITTLADFHYKPIIKAKRGVHGKGKKQHGKCGEDAIVKVPVGTVARYELDGEIVHDFVTDGEEVVMAKGGRGGRGNPHFLSNTNRAPRQIGDFTEGEERDVFLELKMLADVGLVGYPNAGKSTLISHVSNASPKIAAYPFTTLTPNLGVVKASYRCFVIADIPGLIKGAHNNCGLGHEFLRHIERTGVLLFVIDMSGHEGRNPFDDYISLKEELRLYKDELAGKVELIAANKMDVPDADDNLKEFLERTEFGADKVFPVSAASGEGLKEMIAALAKIVENEGRGKDFWE